MKLYNATMHYVEILVAEASFHGTEALTYSSEAPLNIGQLAFVPLRNKEVLGVVTARTQKPKFVAKPVNSVPDIPPIPKHLIDIAEWMREYYPAPLGTIVQQILPKGLPKKEVPLLDAHNTKLPDLPKLTTDQERAIASLDTAGMHILHGDTGTGKTRVYMELALRAMKQGKSSLILTPEIGLTSQLSADLKRIFGNRVIVIHSQLTDATRRKLWLSILREKDPLIIIGPRSALFSPIYDLGFIAIDESHETAYKQDQSPYYHATHVASKLASLKKIPLLLGSATPLISDYFVAEYKKRPIIRMTTTASGGSHQHNISVVDLRNRDEFAKKSYLSDKLIKAVKDTLAKKEQVLLFLNRRGTARVIMCENCGWQALCPHCDLPLVYHNDSHSMLCHSCDYKSKPPTNCPDCHHADVVFKSIGTKALASEAARLFPDATIQRFDTDNKKSERIEQHYEAVKNGDVDIIVGTQTLAKGLDLPKLGLVGVVIADTSLYVPDFSSQERTYQLLSQVVGRIGRGHRDSQAIIQTYNPQNPLLGAVLRKDWDLFYNSELAERKQFLFPPYCFLLKIWCRRATQKGAQNAASKLADSLRHSDYKIIVEGPAPSFHEKINDNFEWQLIIKAKQRGELLKVIANLPANWQHDIDPMNLL
jgi:primosomal protein N' (replication factor Y)